MEHPAVARRPDADISAVTADLPGRYGVFVTGDCALFDGTFAAALPLHRRVGHSLSRPPSCAPSQPCRHVHDCPPPRRCRHPEFSSSLTSSLDSGFTTFSRPSAFSRQQAVGVPAAALAAIIWESRCGLYASTRPHRRSPTPSRHLVGTSYSPLPCLASWGQAIHLYAAWTCQPLYSSPHLVFT